MIVLSLILLSSAAIVSVVGEKTIEKDEPQAFYSKFKSQYFDVGDPRFCLDVNRNAKFDVQRFEVLPGIGWDNLRNIGKGQVVSYNYSKCLSTDDGRFLVPDNVFTIPIKESMIDTFAELIDSWHNTSDTTSSSINVNAGLSVSFVSVSGSFSQEHTQIKKKQIEDKAVTVRVQLRYLRYKTVLQPDAQLHETFKRRLMNVAAYLQLNQTQMAHYQSQLIVRDFGTHVLTSVTAGAGLQKTDFLKRDYVASQFSDKTKVLVSASASFGSIFHVGGSYGHSTDTEDYKSYLKSQTHSYLTSHGGPIMKAFNMSVNDWTSGVDLELVPMDRAGDPLSFLVTRQTLPELPVELVDQVERVLRKNIIQYYEKNTIFGCTKLGSPNFSFSANFDDGSCEADATNMTFGGVYQTCDVRGQYLHNNPCSGMSQVNPKTRTFSCPHPYTAVKLVTGQKVGKPETRRECESCGWFGWSTCCHNHQFTATAVYTAYWCAGLSAIPQASGYLFAGVYSATEDNPITGTKGCPPSFYPRVFLDHQICISDDFEIGLQYSVPFGGFMSCNMGNPLATPGVHPVGKGLKAANPNSLQSFMAVNNNPDSWPKTCPKGYSQHLVSIDNGCEIRYCLKSGSLSGPNIPTVKLPPFNEKPNMVGPKDTEVMFNMKTQEWIQNAHQYSDLYGKESTPWTSMFTMTGVAGGNQNEGKPTMAPGVAAAIGVVVTICCGVLALVAFKAVQRRRQTGGARQLGEETGRLTASTEEMTSGAYDSATGGLASGSGGVTNYGSTSSQGGDSCEVNLPAEV